MAEKLNKVHQEIVDYYDITTKDYLRAWTDIDSSAFHFGFYDENANNHKDALVNTNKVFAELAGIKAGDKVLDAGCGIGGSSFWLAKNLDARPTGITLSQGHVDHCNNRSKVLGLSDKTNFVVGDYINSPFEDESFDVIWSCETLCYIAEKEEFYKESYRLLKPGGRVIIADGILTEKVNTPDEKKIMDDWNKGWAMQGLYTKAKHEEAAKAAGISEFVVMDYTHKTFVSLRNLYRKSKNWLGFFKFLTFLGFRSEIQLKNQEASIRQFEGLEKKLWFYGVMIGKK